jgi:hypothetical protein
MTPKLLLIDPEAGRSKPEWTQLQACMLSWVRSLSLPIKSVSVIIAFTVVWFIWIG